MAIKNYGVLKGRAVDLALDDDDSPHIEILLEASGVKFRIAVNVRSKVPPHDLLYQRFDHFAHPMLAKLKQLPDGLTSIREANPDLAIDYVRGGILKRETMQIAPFTRVGPHNDLRDYIEPTVRRGFTDKSICFYAFGESWGPESTKDRYFGFTPGRGIHDIHMNQGSRGRFQRTNGANQDGALWVHFEEEDRWMAIFLAFQSQSWKTDAHTGHPVNEHPESVEPQAQLQRPGLAIIAALINPYGEEEGRESVTLLNRSDFDMDLTGWRIADRSGRVYELDGRLTAGDTKRVRLEGGPRLGNKGGEIQLLTPDSEVADMVSYTKSQVAREGWTTVF